LAVGFLQRPLQEAQSISSLTFSTEILVVGNSTCLVANCLPILMLWTNGGRNWGAFYKPVVPVQPAGGDQLPWLFSIV
jgi:hypothetical protein